MFVATARSSVSIGGARHAANSLIWLTAVDTRGKACMLGSGSTANIRTQMNGSAGIRGGAWIFATSKRQPVHRATASIAQPKAIRDLPRLIETRSRSSFQARYQISELQRMGLRGCADKG